MPLAQTRMPPGLAGLLAAQEQIRGGEMDELRQAAAAQGLLAQLQERQAAKASSEKAAALQAEIAALPPQQRTRENVGQILMKYGAVKEAASLMPETKALPIGSGGLVRPDGTIVPPQARVGEQKPPESVTPVTIMSGGKKIVIDGRTGRILGEAPPDKPAPQPKAPPGFRFRDDGDLEAIPGGPKDTAPKDAARAKGAIQKADTVIGAVDEALTQTGPLTTGTAGQVLGMIPGTSAYDLDGTLDTIKANLGFAELQAMRDASPTGGALGQVAVQELSMLQSTLASLKRGLSRDKLESGLRKVREHMANWKKAVSEAAPQAPGTAPVAAPQAAPAMPSAPGGWSVREKK